MSEPYVPSGKEFDEGLDPKRKKGKLRRLVQRVTPTHRKRASRVHDLRVTVRPGVGERLPRPIVEDAGTRSAQEPTADISRIESTVTVAKSADVGSRGRTIEQLADELRVDSRVLLACLCARGDLKNPDLRAALSMHLQADSLGASAAALVSWLLRVTGESSEPSDATKLPLDVSAVLDYVERMPGSDGLGTYLQMMDQRRSVTEAIRALDRKAAAYPSLVPIVDVLRLGRADISGLIKYDSAAWEAARSEIVAAQDALRHADPMAMEAPTISTEPAWNADRADAAIANAVLSRCTDIPVINRDVVKSLKRLRAEARAGAEAMRLVEAWGVPPADPATKSTEPRRRRKVVNARTQADAVKRDDARAGGPAPKATRVRRCGSCGVYEATRGALCEGCADGGD